jgi:hypothetical protein
LAVERQVKHSPVWQCLVLQRPTAVCSHGQRPYSFTHVIYLKSIKVVALSLRPIRQVDCFFFLFFSYVATHVGNQTRRGLQWIVKYLTVWTDSTLRQFATLQCHNMTLPIAEYHYYTNMTLCKFTALMWNGGILCKQIQTLVPQVTNRIVSITFAKLSSHSQLFV